MAIIQLDDLEARVQALEQTMTGIGAVIRVGHDIDPGTPPPAERPPSDDNPDYEFTEAGIFHIATLANPVGRIVHPVPHGAYDRVEASWNMTFAGWPQDGRRTAGVWLVHEGNKDMIGYVMFILPTASSGHANHARLAHGLGVINSGKRRSHVSLDHLDMDIGDLLRFNLKVNYDEGTVVLTILNVDNNKQVALHSATKDTLVVHKPIIVDFGFDGSVEDEPISLGWSWSNWHLKMWKS